MNITYFDGRKPIEKHGFRLPHWQQPGALYFLTWRLADALPDNVCQNLVRKKQAWLKMHPKPWNPAMQRDYQCQFMLPLEKYLDKGIGDCFLRKPECAKELQKVMLAFQEVRYAIDCFVIMPNHVHALVQCTEDLMLPALMKAWKGTSSRSIRKCCATALSPLWQKGYWDRMIRDHDHYLRCRRYIRDNPVKAKCSKGSFIYFDAEH